jgi:predicted membrane protein
VLFIILLVHFGYSQENKPIRIISSDKTVLARVFFNGTKYATQTDSLESIVSILLLREIIKAQITAAGFQTLKKSITVKK